MAGSLRALVTFYDRPCSRTHRRSASQSRLAKGYDDAQPHATIRKPWQGVSGPYAGLGRSWQAYQTRTLRACARGIDGSHSVERLPCGHAGPHGRELRGPLVSGCSGVGYHARQVPICDLPGNPQALNATVTLYDGAYQVQASSREDPLTMYTAQDRSGRRYVINVTKPYYVDVWLRGVDTPGGGCVTGHESKPVTRVVPIVLTLAPGAPAVRSAHLRPPRVLLERAP